LEVVTAFIARIQEVNDIINCIVDSRFDEAIEEAQQIDEYLSSLSVVEIEALGK
jgi:Asp-tRNA(Asn)/Glu-tRNA(Gln) amidotransferase A subunit family amidase